MKYLIIGAGGTGGCIGAYMTKANKDVTLVARGAHLKKMQEFGLKIETVYNGESIFVPVKASDTEHYNENPDVIFVCVKGYSVDDIIPFIKRVANKNTVVIPILNIYGTGKYMKEKLPELLVTDGCIYVSSNIKEPGTIIMHGEIFKIVYGVRSREEYSPALDEIAKNLSDCGIEGILSPNIERDALQKFSYVSAMAACGLYFNSEAKGAQKQGEIRDCFARLIREIETLANSMGIFFEDDIVKINLNILDSLAPTASTSLQRDISAGKSSEIDGLIFQVVRMGEKFGVSLPEYKKVAEKFGFYI